MLKLLSKSNDSGIFHLLDVQGFLRGFFETLGPSVNRHPPILFQIPFQ